MGTHLPDEVARLRAHGGLGVAEQRGEAFAERRSKEGRVGPDAAAAAAAVGAPLGRARAGELAENQEGVGEPARRAFVREEDAERRRLDAAAHHKLRGKVRRAEREAREQADGDVSLLGGAERQRAEQVADELGAKHLLLQRDERGRVGLSDAAERDIKRERGGGDERADGAAPAAAARRHASEREERGGAELRRERLVERRLQETPRRRRWLLRERLARGAREGDGRRRRQPRARAEGAAELAPERRRREGRREQRVVGGRAGEHAVQQRGPAVGRAHARHAKAAAFGRAQCGVGRAVGRRPPRFGGQTNEDGRVASAVGRRRRSPQSAEGGAAARSGAHQLREAPRRRRARRRCRRGVVGAGGRDDRRCERRGEGGGALQRRRLGVLGSMGEERREEEPSEQLDLPLFGGRRRGEGAELGDQRRVAGGGGGERGLRARAVEQHAQRRPPRRAQPREPVRAQRRKQQLRRRRAQRVALLAPRTRVGVGAEVRGGVDGGAGRVRRARVEKRFDRPKRLRGVAAGGGVGNEAGDGGGDRARLRRGRRRRAEGRCPRRGRRGDRREAVRRGGRRMRRRLTLNGRRRPGGGRLLGRRLEEQLDVEARRPHVLRARSRRRVRVSRSLERRPRVARLD